MAVTARFQADFSSFQQAVDKAQVYLKSFETGAGKVEGSLSRMGNSFSGIKIIQEATAMVKAIEQIGGASNLTDKELARAGKTAQEAAEKMQKLGLGVPANLQAIADAAAKQTKQTDVAGISFSKLVGSYITAQAIMSAVRAGFDAIVGGIQSSIKAAGDAEKAHVQLVAALRAQGTAVPSVVTAYQEYATALQRTTVFQDDAVEGAAALLVQIGNVMPRDMKKALEATTNLASGLGMDLDAAVRLVAKSAEGNTGALKKIGVVMDEDTAKGGDFGKVLDAINDKFGGQAAAVASTYEGRLKQLGNTWNNVEESVGRVITQNATLLSAFDALNRMIDTNTGELNSNQMATNLVSDAVITAVRGVKLFASALDGVQTFGAAFVIGLRDIVQGLDKVGIAALYVVKTTAFAQNNWALFAQASAQIEIVEKRITAYGAANEVTTQKSVGLGMALDTIGQKADELAAQLATTRGQTVKVSEETDKYTGAWDRNTKAASAGSDASKKHAESLAEVNKKIIEASTAVKGLTATEVTAVLGLRDMGLSAKEMALKVGASEQAVKQFIAAWDKIKDVAKLNDEAERSTTRLALAIRERLLPNTISLATAAYNLGTQFNRFDGENEAVALHLLKTNDNLKGLGVHLFAANDGLKDTTKSAVGMKGSLNDITNAFAQLAQISGDSFGGVNKGLGMTIGLMNTASEITKKFTTTTVDLATGVTKTQVAWQGVALSIATAGLAMYQFVQAENAAHDAAVALELKLRFADDLAKDFQSATLFSDGLNASIAKSGDLVRQLGPELAKLVGVGLPDMQQVTEDLRNGIDPKDNAELVTYIENLGRLGEAFNLAGIISELGGVTSLTAAQFKTVGVQFATLFAVIPAGGRVAVEATKAMDEALVAFGQSAVKSGGFVSQMFLDTIKQAQAAGIELAGVNDFIVGQLGRAGQGLTALIGGMAESAKAGGEAWTITTQQATGLGAAIAGTFGEAISRGASFAEALGMIQAPLDALNAQLAGTGITGGAAFGFLGEMASIANDTITGPLAAGIQGAGEALVGLGNSGILTQEMFEGIGSTATTAFQAILAEGKNGDAALALMQPTLQKLWEAEERFGFKADEATQALIDQAVEAGRVGPGMQNTQEQLLSVMKDIRNVLAEATGHAGDFADAISKIPNNKHVTITQETVTLSSGGGDDGRAPTDPYLVSRGGLVTATGIQHFARGGWAKPRGTDTVPAMLTPGEMVLTKPQQQALFSGNGDTINVSIAIDRPLLTDRQAIKDLADEIETALARKFQTHRKTRAA